MNILEVLANGTVSLEVPVDKLYALILMFSGNLTTQLSEHVKQTLTACP